jgi:hypothetical protein
MHRWWSAAVLAAMVSVALPAATLMGTAPAGASSALSVHVTPSKGLVNGQSVEVSGRGLAKTYHGKAETWFITQCNADVQGELNATADEKHCDISLAKQLTISAKGTFSTHFAVATGVVGDGYCGTAGHLSCVIGVGTVQSQGTVVRITFKAPTT